MPGVENQPIARFKGPIPAADENGGARVVPETVVSEYPRLELIPQVAIRKLPKLFGEQGDAVASSAHTVATHIKAAAGTNTLIKLVRINAVTSEYFIPIETVPPCRGSRDKEY